MHIGMVGLGRMGMNMTRRLMRFDHRVTVYNRSPEKVAEIAAEGAFGSNSLEEMVHQLPSPRICFLMLPAGDPTENAINRLADLLSPGDIVIEGGNSRYTDDLRRAEFLKEGGISFFDAGISGGIWGLNLGYCSMIGGPKEKFEVIEPIFRSLAPKEGYLYCGSVGAGHYVKMIHNGIEYALMEAYGEGFELLKASPYGGNLDPAQVAGLWSRGSVIRSWLLELLQQAFLEHPALEDIQGYVEDSGEARWTVLEAVDRGVAADVITASLYKRFQSRQTEVFSNKVTAALRNQFGGHAVAKAGEDLRSSGAGSGEVRAARKDHGYSGPRGGEA